MSKLNEVLHRINHSEYFKSISETVFDLKEENKNSEYLYDRLYDLVEHIIDKAKAAKMREE